MKKVISISMILIMILSFTSCGKKDDTSNTDNQDNGASEASVEWIDDAFGELSYKVRSNWRKDESGDGKKGGQVKYYIKDEGTEIHIASIPEIIKYHSSAEEFIKDQNKDELADIDSDDDDKYEVVKEEPWDNGSVSGYQTVIRETDEDGSTVETNVAIITDKTCYYISFEIEDNEQGITEAEFEDFLKKITLS